MVTSEHCVVDNARAVRGHGSVPARPFPSVLRLLNSESAQALVGRNQRKGRGPLCGGDAGRGVPRPPLSAGAEAEPPAAGRGDQASPSGGPGSGRASRAAPRRRPGQAAGCRAIFTPDPVALVRGLLHLGTGEREAAALPAPGAWLQGRGCRGRGLGWLRGRGRRGVASGRGFGGGAARVPLVHSHGGTFSSFLKRKI